MNFSFCLFLGSKQHLVTAYLDIIKMTLTETIHHGKLALKQSWNIKLTEYSMFQYFDKWISDKFLSVFFQLTFLLQFPHKIEWPLHQCVGKDCLPNLITVYWTLYLLKSYPNTIIPFIKESKIILRYWFWVCFPTTNQRYTDRVLQTIQMKLILLWVWAERAVLGRAKTALKFKYEI